MLNTVKKWLYDVITSSRIIYYLLPFLKSYLMSRYFGPSPDVVKITDANGDTMNTTKYKGKSFPAVRISVIAGISSLKIRHDDVLLCGYPKTGCHWMYEILHMLVKRKAVLSANGKFFEGMIEAMPQIVLDSVPSPRVLNSHVLYEDLPVQVKENKNKIILTIRNPKDTVVSFYNHTIDAFANEYEYKGSFDNYFKLFMAGRLEYGSYFDYTLDWERIMKTQKDNPILLVEFENLKRNPTQEVKAIARFLEIDVSDDFISKVVDVSSFNKVKAARGGHKVFRQGTTGGWRNWLTDAQSAELDQAWKERMSGSSYKPQM